MLHIDSLKNDFARARIPLRLEPRPFVRGVFSNEIVQLDIRRWSDRGEPREEVRLYPGKGTEVAARPPRP
jgi:hypothetical protein